MSRDQRHGAQRGRRPPGSFRCRNCGLDVPADAPGTAHRNHCPSCLWSRHLDHTPGDRRAECGSSMEPIAIHARPDGEWALVHRCTGCRTVHVNRIAGVDNPLPLLRLAVTPLARPPFPLDWLSRI